MNELKCCPFCGEGNRLHVTKEGVGKAYYVMCYACKTMGPVTLYGGDAAIELWNTRADKE